MEDKRQEQFRGAFLGAAIGDALGFITEFMKKPSEIRTLYQVDRLNNLVDWERFTKYFKGKPYLVKLPLPSGTYSDDTQLTLATVRSLRADGSFNPISFSKFELPLWLHYELGGGSGTKAAARNLLQSNISWHNNFYNVNYSIYTKSGGNGAAMRILPIALVNVDNPNRRYLDVWKNSIITHGHPRGILGAILFADSISLLFKNPKGKTQWLNELIELSTNIYPTLVSFWENHDDFSEWKRNWSILEGRDFDDAWIEICQETSKNLRLVQENSKKNASIKSTLTALGCYRSETKGAGTSTVIAAILYLCQMTSPDEEHSFEEIIASIANEIGIDTDTIAYFAGAMLGTYYGEKSIPTHFKESIKDSHYIVKVANWCYQAYKKDESIVPIFQYPDYGKVQNIKSASSYLGENLEVDMPVNIPILGKGKVISDVNITPNWERTHLHFISVALEIGQTVFFKLERKVGSSSASSSTEVKPSSTRSTEKSTSVVSQITALENFKEQMRRSDFDAEVLLEILTEIKFSRKDKSLYNAFTTWLWSALPKTDF